MCVAEVKLSPVSAEGCTEFHMLSNVLCHVFITGESLVLFVLQSRKGEDNVVTCARGEM